MSNRGRGRGARGRGRGGYIPAYPGWMDPNYGVPMFEPRGRTPYRGRGGRSSSVPRNMQVSTQPVQTPAAKTTFSTNMPLPDEKSDLETLTKFFTTIGLAKQVARFLTLKSTSSNGIVINCNSRVAVPVGDKDAILLVKSYDEVFGVLDTNKVGQYLPQVKYAREKGQDSTSRFYMSAFPVPDRMVNDGAEQVYTRLGLKPTRTTLVNTALAEYYLPNPPAGHKQNYAEMGSKVVIIGPELQFLKTPGDVIPEVKVQQEQKKQGQQQQQVKKAKPKKPRPGQNGAKPWVKAPLLPEGDQPTPLTNEVVPEGNNPPPEEAARKD